MSHVRKQIRDAIVTALTGLSTTGSRVYAGRSLPLYTGGGSIPSELPALCIYTREEQANYADGILTNAPLRELTVRVEGYVDGTDDDLDTIAEEVETAFFTDYTFGGLTVGAELGEQSINVDREGDDQYGVIVMTFNVMYRTAEGVPGTAV